jgi:hypothetical protein
MQVKVTKQLLPVAEELGKMDMPIVLMPIDELRPHEKGLPIYLEILKHEITCDGMIKYPLIADENTHVILDGMHRWLALKSLGYSLIPCILVRSDMKCQIRVGKKRIDQYKRARARLRCICLESCSRILFQNEYQADCTISRLGESIAKKSALGSDPEFSRSQYVVTRIRGYA